MTSVSRIPDLDYESGMSRFIACGEDVLVIPQLEEGTIWQLAFDGWEWVPVAEHETLEWLGYSRVYPQWVFPIGDEILVMDGSPVMEGVHVPEATILRRINGVFQPVETVSLASKLQDPQIWSLSINGLVPLRDLLVFRNQVNLLGIGPKLFGHTFVKTDSGWITGPAKEFPTGYWWPLYTESMEDGLHLWHMEMTGSYFDDPQQFAIIESLLTPDSWTEVDRSPFTFNHFWGGIYENLRAIVSPDKTSMLLFTFTDFETEIPPVELSRIDGHWSFKGLLSDSGIDTQNLHLVLPEGEWALLRRGDIASVYVPQEPQHYHLLKHAGGQWQLLGDLVSHRTLQDYAFNEIFYAMDDDWLTIFDVKPYWKQARGARSFRLEDFSPRLVKWFRDSQTIDAQVEWIPAFGYFASEVSDNPQAIWTWHWNLGWIYIAGRDHQGFWFYDAVFGWTWFADSLYDREQQRYWLYSWSHDDYVWSLADSFSPRFFFSSGISRWLTDTPAPEMQTADIDEAIAAISDDFKETGISVVVDYESHMAIFSYKEKVGGKDVTLSINAPWFYQTGTGYVCQARFEMDFSSLSLTTGGETVYFSSYDLWTQEKILMPASMVIHFIFYTSESGTTLTRIQNNDMSWETPVPGTFGPGD